MKNEALLDAVEKAIEALEAVRSELLKAEEAEEGIRIDCEPGAEVTIWPLGTGPAPEPQQSAKPEPAPWPAPEPEPQLNVCPNCGMPYETGSKFCMNCGTPILSAPPAPSAARSAFCMNCGEPLAPGDKFCMNCGTRV
jgi:ribosomal protein L32